MDTRAMAREKLAQLLLLRLMLSQAIITMAILTDMVTDMATMGMERGKLMLPLDITMDMAIMDMVDMDTMDMDMERGRPPPLIIVMILVDMIMALFISFVALTGICWNPLSRNTDLFLEKSFFEIKRKK